MEAESGGEPAEPGLPHRQVRCVALSSSPLSGRGPVPIVVHARLLIVTGMSLSSSSLDRTAVRFPQGAPPVGSGAALIAWARGRLLADGRRTIQVVLGLIWLLDGALQFQSFMYGRGFIETLTAGAVGQPPWVADSVNWAASTLQSEQALLNTLCALVQITIGLGLLHRRTVKPALALSFVWALLVWWFGEGFGMMLMSMANPLSGAPGAAILYLLVGLVVWPGENPGGLLGVRGARLMWGALWLLMAWLWFAAPGSSPNAISETIQGAPAGAGWLTHLQVSIATVTAGHGHAIGLTLAWTSIAIGLAVAGNWHARPFLWASIVLNLVFWVVGQGFGGIFAGGATDPNAAPLSVLLACALYALTPLRSGPAAAPADRLAAGARS